MKPVNLLHLANHLHHSIRHTIEVAPSWESLHNTNALVWTDRTRERMGQTCVVIHLIVSKQPSSNKRSRWGRRTHSFSFQHIPSPLSESADGFKAKEKRRKNVAPETDTFLVIRSYNSNQVRTWQISVKKNREEI